MASINLSGMRCASGSSAKRTPPRASLCSASHAVFFNSSLFLSVSFFFHLHLRWLCHLLLDAKTFRCSVTAFKPFCHERWGKPSEKVYGWNKIRCSWGVWIKVCCWFELLMVASIQIMEQPVPIMHLQVSSNIHIVTQVKIMYKEN